MDDRGMVGREAESVVSHQQREKKLKLTPDELKALHKAHAAEFGDQPAQVVAQAAERQARALTPEKMEEKVHKAVSFASDRLSERSAVFEHFELIRDPLRNTQGKALLADIKSELTRQREQGKFIEVSHVRPFAPAARYTTPQLVEVKRETIARVRSGQGQVQPIVVVSDSTLLERYGKRLNADQRQLVRDALNTSDQIFGIQGRVGGQARPPL